MVKALLITGLVFLFLVTLSCTVYGQLYSENFESYNVNDNPGGWYDTAADNSMKKNDSLFKIFNVNGNKAFGTSNNDINIHSHYIAGDAPNWENYQFSGKLRISHEDAGAGVTLYSNYPTTDSYYRLRRSSSSRALQIAPHPDGVTPCVGDRDTDVNPKINTWYYFRIQAMDEGVSCDELTPPAQIQQDGINVLTNGNFSANKAPWVFYTNGAGVFSVVNGEAKVVISADGTNVQLYQPNLVLEGNTQYRLTFKARHTASKPVHAILLKHTSPFTNYGLNQNFGLTNTMQSYSIDFTTISGGKTDGRFMFYFPDSDVVGSSFYFDDVKLEKMFQCTPQAEICDGLDNDCDGTIDNGITCECALTRVRAKVWEENTPEPPLWQADCVDSRTNRLTAGSFGLWSMGPGEKYWDGLKIDNIGPVCGNGIVEQGEECDGFNLTGQTCQTQGYQGGILSCYSDCTFNPTQCISQTEEPRDDSGKRLNFTVKITINGTNSKVFIPDNIGERNAGAIGNLVLFDPKHFYAASYINDVLTGLVAAKGSAFRASSTPDTHTFAITQDILKSRIFLTFTEGDYKNIEKNIELIKKENFLSQISPSFAYGLGVVYPIKLVLEYPDIDIQNDLILKRGEYKLTITYLDVLSGRPLVNIRIS